MESDLCQVCRAETEEGEISEGTDGDAPTAIQQQLPDATSGDLNKVLNKGVFAC